MSKISAFKAYPAVTSFPNPSPWIHLAKITSTATCGLLLGSTIWASAAVLPSLIATPLPTHSKLSILTTLTKKTNLLLPPLLALATGSLTLLSYYSFSISSNSSPPSSSSLHLNTDSGFFASGFFASLAKAPTTQDAGISIYGGTELGPSSSGRNFFIGALALGALMALQVRNREMDMEEMVSGGRGKDDDGGEADRRIGEVMGWNWGRVVLAGVAFGVSVGELGR